MAPLPDVLAEARAALLDSRRESREFGLVSGFELALAARIVRRLLDPSTRAISVFFASMIIRDPMLAAEPRWIVQPRVSYPIFPRDYLKFRKRPRSLSRPLPQVE